ncbi:MAG: hypothetical protein H6708_05080 [Kofleriaceae bacterium]|nr:hypothetical protein [Myxococcales bacterium]MCB9559761.1 hypothetical protein [Kofleriaceae bacterium]
MSYDFIVYVRGDQLPDPSRLAAELEGCSPPVRILPGADIRQAEGFFPVEVAGRRSGFEVWRSPITGEDVARHKATLARLGEPDDDHLTILSTCDMDMTLTCHDADEIAAAKLVAGALATLSRGFLCDPQEDVTVEGRYL